MPPPTPVMSAKKEKVTSVCRTLRRCKCTRCRKHGDAEQVERGDEAWRDLDGVCRSSHMDRLARHCHRCLFQGFRMCRVGVACEGDILRCCAEFHRQRGFGDHASGDARR